MTPTPNETTAPPAPLLRIERGDPTPEELAALIAVVRRRLAARLPEQAPRLRAPARWYRPQPTPFEPRAWRSSSFRRAA
ncbi:acyl-CoA carboxylase subunit epsilon [Streptomyces sp. KL118A]|uniref:acyl-CoA carboxylase subunit epsilon n=1 Tax=Streptomyces sp. KL118A TaxID=3045153 RepID=UPI00278BF8FD|nr:acyl-CoA carboxylase subunit epsilon [Streptomyces sp. KL118A]